ncbi:hypothetical protein C095_03245 [Fusobacterium necrophorum subsp. funduliforme B35]|uniref:Uncharacterized protein n=1 Tax=Fusobacterium necrophorum subsp. funduliforme B35 TaxID=1226633 RepID=A0A0B4EY00_9FUSO|nr:hypothetical protein C095_03245 [Fusobacterium necrophorum subsp. funduliforme B35]
MVDNAIQMVTEKLSSWPCVRGIILGVHVQEAPIQKILI